MAPPQPPHPDHHHPHPARTMTGSIPPNSVLFSSASSVSTPSNSTISSIRSSSPSAASPRRRGYSKSFVVKFFSSLNVFFAQDISLPLPFLTEDLLHLPQQSRQCLVSRHVLPALIIVLSEKQWRLHPSPVRRPSAMGPQGHRHLHSP